MLGAIVDIIGGKKQFLGVALALGALGSLSLAFLGKDRFLLASCIRDCQPGFCRAFSYSRSGALRVSSRTLLEP